MKSKALYLQFFSLSSWFCFFVYIFRVTHKRTERRRGRGWNKNYNVLKWTFRFYCWNSLYLLSSPPPLLVVVAVIIDNTQSHTQCARRLCMCKWMHFMEFSIWMNIYHRITVSSSGIPYTTEHAYIADTHGRIRLLKRFSNFGFVSETCSTLSTRRSVSQSGSTKLVI